MAPGAEEDPERTLERLYAAINALVTEAIAGLVDPDVTWTDPAELPGGGTFRGPAEVAGHLRELTEAIEGLRYSRPETIPSGDRLFVRTIATGRGAGSGIDMEIEFFSVYTIRDGRVVEQTSFFDRAEAERALEGS